MRAENHCIRHKFLELLCFIVLEYFSKQVCKCKFRPLIVTWLLFTLDMARPAMLRFFDRHAVLHPRKQSSNLGYLKHLNHLSLLKMVLVL